MTSNRQKYELYSPKKKFGQNFLVDDNISRKIIKSLEAGPDDVILEIGPGRGALTKFLVDEYPNFYAVEIDGSAAKELKSEFTGLKLFEGDILRFDLGSILKDNNPGRIKVIGNIPYNITSEILFRLLDNIRFVESAVLMVQKEVADRLVAEPRTKQYGILSVQFGAFAEMKHLFTVPRTAFFPKPDVTSSVIRLNFKEEQNSIDNVPLFRSLVRNAFSKRRKTLKNSLRDFFNANNLEYSEFDVDFSRRAETLTVNEFVVLSNGINSYLRGRMVI